MNVYRFRDMTVMRFMLTALLVGAVGIQTGVSLGFAASAPIPPTSMLANVVGGVVFGVGMASAGYCPGTIVAEAGEGRLDAWIAGLLGLIAGAIVFGLLQPTIMPALTRVGALGRVTFAELTGASPWPVLLVFGQAVVLVLVLTIAASIAAELASRGHQVHLSTTDPAAHVAATLGSAWLPSSSRSMSSRCSTPDESRSCRG